MTKTEIFERKILNHLADRYERSVSFMGKNRIKQSFSAKPAEFSKAYLDDADFETFSAFNEAAEDAERRGFVSLTRRGDVVTSIRLIPESLGEVYAFLGRIPRREAQNELKELLLSYAEKCGDNEILSKYCHEQMARLSANKKLSPSADYDTLKDILKVLEALPSLKEETYERDFSAAMLGNSKAFEKIKGKVIAILGSCGDESESPLEDRNLVRNPGHVFFKGAGRICLGEAGSCTVVDVGSLRMPGGKPGDIGISSALLTNVREIKISAKRVVTIENLTSFNDFSEEDAFAIYLGGYHNAARRSFLKILYEQNPDKEYLHFGDIDAGGLYILLHLRERTGVPFKPYLMGMDELKSGLASGATLPLSENDRKRLLSLREKTRGEFDELIDFMLKNNCKMEQEQLFDFHLHFFANL